MFYYKLQHSHKKRKDDLETWAVHIEISLASWNLPNGPKHRGSILKNIASYESGQLLAGASRAIMRKIEADILQVATTGHGKLIFIRQGCFFRKILARNASFAPKYVHPQGWSLKFGQNVKMFQAKFWNRMQQYSQVNKT